MKTNVIKLLSLLLLLNIYSCSKDSTDDNGDDNNTEEETVFVMELKMTITENGQDVYYELKEGIEGETEVDEIDGYDIKRFYIYQPGYDIYPSFSMEFPYKVGEYVLGTSYGSSRNYVDDLQIATNEDTDYTASNSEYQYLIDGEYEEPWVNVISIDNGEVEAEFGGTFIQRNQVNNEYIFMSVSQASIKILATDYSIDAVDNSSAVAVPPPAGIQPNNIMADFEVRKPYSYVAGEEMLFDTASIQIVNKCNNATHYRWETLYASSENYFLEETISGANSSFSKIVHLSKYADTSSLTIFLTAYDDFGNYKSVTKTIKFPMLKSQLFVDGVEKIGADPRYGDTFNNSINIMHDSLTPNLYFAEMGYFPSTSMLTPLYQTRGYTHSDGGNYAFKVLHINQTTFDDPEGDYSEMIIDNYSNPIINNEYYQIFSRIYVQYTLDGPGGETHTLEYRNVYPILMWP